MPQPNHDTIAIFKENAAKVSTTVVEVKNLDEALDYALKLCPQGDKIFAAPDISTEQFAQIQAKAAANGTQVSHGNLRANLNGIAVGFTQGDIGIADTATVIMSSEKEDPRIASMLSEIHVLTVPKSKVLNDSYEAETYLQKVLASPTYTTFISGCSRTSDIERVLTLGVHGPLELHVALLEEA